MSDVQRIVHDVQGAVRSGQMLSNDQLSEIASAYATACREVNLRLARCGEYLRNGLQGEAIHLAEVPPRLIDTVTLLDFEERNQWHELVQKLGLEQAGPVPMEIADAVNQTYTQYQPLQESMRKHRLLALARAPIAQRLALMREVARRCPGTFWEEDVEQFEKARHAEMRPQVKKALQERDAATLRSLQDEIEKAPWLLAPPQTLVNSVRSALEKMAHTGARDKLWELVPQLNDALAAFDVERGRQLMATWKEIVRESGFDPPFGDKVQEAFAWLAEEDERQARGQAYTAALAKLQAGLDNPAMSRDALENLWREAARHGKQIPQQVVHRLQSHLEALEARQTFRTRMMLLAAGGALLAVIIIIAALIFWHERAASLAKTSNTVKEMLDEYDFLNAQKYVEKQIADHPWMANHRDVEQIKADIEEAKNTDDSRAKEFQRARQELEHARDEGAAQAALGKAVKQARTDAEKTELQRIKDDRARDQKDHETERLKSFQMKVTELTSILNDRQQLTPLAQHLQQAQQLLTAANNSLGRLRTDLQNVREMDSTFPGTVEGLEHRLEAIRAEYDAAVTHATLEIQITDSVGDHQRYMALLTNHIDKMPKSERSDQFRRVLGESELGESHLEWEKMLHSWRAAPIPSSPSAATARVDGCKQFRQRYPTAADAATALNYQKLVEPITQRGPEGEAESGIGKLFSNPLVKDVWVVRMKTGQTYYIKEEPPKLPGNFTVSYIIDLNGNTARKGFQAKDIQYAGAAPQSALAAKAQTEMNKLSSVDWEESVIRLAELVRAEQDVDAVLRLAICEQLMKRGSMGSLPLQLTFQEYLGDLKKEMIDTATKWMVPDNKDADKVRKDATVFMNSHPFSDLMQTARKHREEALKIIEPERAWVGWLHRKEEGWTCTLREPRATNSTLWIIVPSDGDPARWVEIGRTMNGRTTLVSKLGAANLLIEGRPVFAMAREAGD